MTASYALTPANQSKLDGQLAAIDARCAEAKALSNEAKAIVDAAIPAPTGQCPHGFFDFGKFIERSQIIGRRHALYSKTCHELAARNARTARIAKDAGREAEMIERNVA